MKNNICPYCLEQKTIAARKDKDEKSHYSCSACNSRIPRGYAENTKTPIEVVSAVGFRGHGKTIYFSSLFYSRDILASIWPDFYTLPADEETLKTIKKNITELEKEDLPPRTPISFPKPTIVEFCNIPGLGNRFFIFYDTGGETYETPSDLGQYALFVKRSQTVIFLISLEDLVHEEIDMYDLLQVYVLGLNDKLEGNTKNQHLIVVFCKGDILEPRLRRWEEIWEYLINGRLESMKNISIGNYIDGMKRISGLLKDFTKTELKENQFINCAKNRFKSYDFSIVSSLGSNPIENRLRTKINPKRIFDPLLWIIYKSLSRFKKIQL
ncbi:MAG: hypothetical protein GTO45_17515 [Candidatus Aminicenantes bacterium]|nr:hypothetical protein [Candidatus Aminicenantes bacterium]NIM80548.1 hypothetical protein [Candidatus Aminicenantes bacterium]NIN19929.1 hypothetical protein [Candidatus Aminicenantes bacterium]NIN43777.1 hypothetical protein [Candidatus Aminicenantes bacterium]NIN86555.1 hypothetical protein [Candidatus Aminicenantes bacterium]